MAVVILALIGVAACGAAISSFVQQRRAKGGVIVAGTIVDIDTSRSRRAGDGHRTTYHAPVVEYTDAGGTAHRFTSRLAGSARPVVGTTRQVSYRPDKPGQAVLIEAGSERNAKWAFLVTGLAALVGAIVLAVG